MVSTLNLDRPRTDLHSADSYLLLGNIDEALTWAEKAFSEHNLVIIAYPNSDHNWNLVCSDPRFVALLMKAGQLK